MRCKVKNDSVCPKCENRDGGTPQYKIVFLNVGWKRSNYSFYFLYAFGLIPTCCLKYLPKKL